MPLRLPLNAHRPRGPEPTHMREVRCPTCSRRFSVSQRAYSARCPGCSRHFEFRDIALRQSLDGDITTMGHVHITGEGQMRGQTICGQLTVDGDLRGITTVYGPMVVNGEGVVRGQTHASSLHVLPGGQLKGNVVVGDGHKLAAAAQRCGGPIRRHPSGQGVPYAVRKVTELPDASTRSTIEEVTGSVTSVEQRIAVATSTPSAGKTESPTASAIAEPVMPPSGASSPHDGWSPDPARGQTRNQASGVAVTARTAELRDQHLASAATTKAVLAARLQHNAPSHTLKAWTLPWLG